MAHAEMAVDHFRPDGMLLFSDVFIDCNPKPHAKA
jgi:hypothetical protein